MSPSDPYVALIVIGIILLIVFLGGRPRREVELNEPPSGAELIERLQGTLGIAIVAALARAAIEWRDSDFQHVPIWPGGG